MIKIKHVYDKVDESDGYRILVDRLWPRGLTKSEAQISDWQKTIAPSEKPASRIVGRSESIK